MTPITLSFSPISGVLGDTIASSSKSLNILPGKSAKVTFQIKSLPPLEDGVNFLVAGVVDPFAGGASFATDATSFNIVAPVITLASTLGPASKTGDTLAITNNGNVPDNISKIVASLGVSTDPAGADTVGGSAVATVGAPGTHPGRQDCEDSFFAMEVDHFEPWPRNILPNHPI